MEYIPFDRKEVENAAYEPAFFPGRPDTVVFDYPISQKENQGLAYNGKIPLWMPSGADSQLWAPRIDPDNIARVQVIEAVPLQPEEMTGCPDKFGIPWVYVPQAMGSMVVPGDPTLLDANDWQDLIQFPDVASWDWDGLAESNKDFVKTSKWLSFAFVTGFFERLISFMDFENAAVALIDDDQKDAVHGLFSELVDCYCDIIGRAYNVYPFDAIWFHDDWGSQRAPFFNLDVAMEMIVPYLKRVREFCHSINVKFDMHSCGKNEILVPAYVEIGADSWSGQPMNDKKMIYDKYGDKLLLGMELDIPNMMVNPDLTLDEAKAAGQRFIDTYVPNYKEKQVLMGNFMGPAGFSEFMYEASRNAFYELAKS
ncbi:MAG: methyltransferase [Coriobacteriia bacterium]|nr:methyltransferase [Coriobacteriia bacterium]